MALRGSLHEFELPDIFQLIANDGKTGQLVIYNKENEAFVIFFRGAVIAAGNNTMNLQTILFGYLMDVRGYSQQELNELLYLCQGEMKLFTQELVNKRYLIQEELAAIARMGIEDLACGLFLWENGHYRFDSLESVDDYRVGGVSLSSDAVTMEAMRRLDEWKRMSAVIAPDTVFVPVKSNAPTPRAGTDGFSVTDSPAYIFSLVDGVTSVDELCRGAFFTEYRIYETLMDLWQNNRIMPFKMPHTASKTATQQKTKKTLPAMATGTFSFVIVHCVAMLIVALGYLLNTTVFEKRTLTRKDYCREVSAFHSDKKVRIASLHYHGMYGREPDGDQQLIEAGFLFPGDK